MRTAALLMAAMFAIAAALTAYAAIVNAEWFFRSPNVRILTGSFKRSVQRAIYGVLAVAMASLAVHLVIRSFAESGM